MKRQGRPASHVLEARPALHDSHLAIVPRDDEVGGPEQSIDQARRFRLVARGGRVDLMGDDYRHTGVSAWAGPRWSPPTVASSRRAAVP